MIGVIVLLLLIPLTMLRGVVSERSALREQAYQKVAEGWGGDLVRRRADARDTDRAKVDRRQGSAASSAARSICYPSQLEVNVELKLEEKPRYVGIYAVPVYLAARAV